MKQAAEIRDEIKKLWAHSLWQVDKFYNLNFESPWDFVKDETTDLPTENAHRRWFLNGLESFSLFGPSQRDRMHYSS